jgi:hypothetical protein
MGAFGLLRAAVVLGAAGVRSPTGLLLLADRLARWDRPVRLTAIATQASLALVALVLAVS